MEEELKRTALIGDIDVFYGVIEREPEILKIIEERDFVETPLHVATSVGNTDLAIEILNLKPSFAKKLNPSGYSPFDMALLNGRRETVKRLIKYDPGLIGVGSREGKTPLHYVAETDDADLVAEFLVACPAAVKELTIRGETALHLAVLRGSTNAFKVIMGWITRTDKKHALKWKDSKDNTLLHIAAQTSQVEVVKRLIKEGVDLDERNEENETALDIVRTSIRQSVQNSTSHDLEDAEIQEILQQAGAKESSELPNLMSMKDNLTSYDVTERRKLDEEIVDSENDKSFPQHRRNAYLVVAVLITTSSYQSILSPPGGGWQISQNDNINSNVTLPAPPPAITSTVNHHNELISKDDLFYQFYIANTIAFFTSVVLALLLILDVDHGRRSLFLIRGLLECSISSLWASYTLGSLVMAPPDKKAFAALVPVVVGLVVLLNILYRLYRLCSWFRLYYKKTTSLSQCRIDVKVRRGKYVA